MGISKNTPITESLIGQAILEGMPQFAYVFNRDFKLLMWNKNLQKVLGYTDDELNLMHVDKFVCESNRKENLDAAQRIFDTKNKESLVQILITKSGKKIPILDSASYTFINDKEYLVGMAIDITDLKETEDALIKTIKELDKLKNQMKYENIYLRKEISNRHDFDDIIGDSEALMHSLYRVEQVAETDTTVLLEGETGTGKELFAMAIHGKSKRAGQAFIKLNCASLPASLIESELFGHEKGAFTGAVQKQVGRFELAHNGTIFLDEIGEIPIELQSKLLRVIQEGEFERLGSSKTKKINVRIIAATNKNLEDQIKKKLFRKDLYYRLNVYPITIAPLRDRISDIPILAQHFVNHFNKRIGKNIKTIPKKTINQLQSYTWPGNIREFENIIERAVIVSTGTGLIVEQLHKPDFDDEDELLPLAEYERNYIIRVLKKTYWRVDGKEGAAKILDMHPETLRSRMRKLQISRPN
jgi:PAS domain S-box-containing protein